MSGLIKSKWTKKPWVIVTIVLSLIVIAAGFPTFLDKFGFTGAILFTLLVVALVWGTYALRAYLFSSHEKIEKDKNQ